MVQWWSRSQSSMVIRSSRFGQASQTTSSCRLMSSCDPPSSQAPTAGHHPEDSSRVGTLGCWDKWKAWKFLGKDPWNNYGKWFDVLLAPLCSECIGILQRLPLFDKCQAIRWSGHGCWAWAGIPRGHMGSWTASPPDFRSEHVRSSIDTSGIARPQGANRHSIYLWKLFVIYIYIYSSCVNFDQLACKSACSHDILSPTMPQPPTFPTLAGALGTISWMKHGKAKWKAKTRLAVRYPRVK